jgi:hypothetical protein
VTAASQVVEVALMGRKEHRHRRRG